jgi:fatty-acyl-CoA synthase
VYKYPLIIKKLWLTPLRRSPQKEIVYRGEKRVNYKELFDRLKKIANALESIGVSKGTKIGVLDWNTLEYFEAYFAIPMMGAVLHTINLRLSPEQIIYTVNYAEDSYLMFRDEFLPLVEKIAPHIPSVKGWIIISERKEIPESKIKPLYNYHEIVNSAASIYEFPEFDEDTDAAIYFTSGTVGLPKPIRFSHRQIMLQTFINLSTNLFPNVAKMDSTDVILHIPPLFHGLGWFLPYLGTLLGCKQVLPGKLDGKLILELIKNERVTYMAGVPTLLMMFLNHPDVENYREYLNGLKFIIDGEHPPRSLMIRAWSYGIRIFEAYGMSEGVGYTFANLKEHMMNWDLEKQLDYLNKAGLPAPLVEVKVVDEKGNEVPWDGKTIGEIWLRSPGLITEYWKDERKTKEAFTEDGWFKTGDLGVVDPEGYLLIVDRAKDVIKSGGEWIPSKQLEDLIASHEAVYEVAVIAAKSNKWSERPVALIIPKPTYKDKINEDDIRKFLMKYVELGKIPKWWIPDKFIFVNEFPRTSVGKVDKKVLRDQLKDLVLP